MSLIGGALGMLLGSGLIVGLGAALKWPMAPSPAALVVGAAVSGLIGVAFGYLARAPRREARPDRSAEGRVMFGAIRIAFRAIRKNGLRAALTVLGILIGVAAVVVVTALGDGAAQIGRLADRVARLELHHRLSAAIERVGRSRRSRRRRAPHRRRRTQRSSARP